MSELPVKKPNYYVAIGASAGGLEAIEKFFSNMPDDSGMSFIVIQHLSPDYKSLMVELLSKHTEMPVKRAEEGMLVEKNTVYLIPPKSNLTIFHGKLLLSERNDRQSLNLPIDIFFTSLAHDQGERAIGVVLSGTGSDGTRGVKSIREANGIVMAQSGETAQFDTMPKNAILTGSVDLILAPDEMPTELLSYIKNPYVSKEKRAVTQGGVDRLLGLVRDKTSVDFTHYKPSTVLRRIERRIAVNQLDSLQEYMDLLDSSPNEIHSLYKDILIGVTSFFRDKDAFDFIKNKVVAEIIRDSNPKEEIRIWSAGCSTGEEAYSLAILFQEMMEQVKEKRRVKIFATDIDEDAIFYAGNGEYPESIAADIPSAYLAKYFTKKEHSYHITRHIREMVVFAKHNLTKDPPFTKMDLISCRNLLIYFQPVLQKKAMEMFSFALNRGGYLFLGSSETTGDLFENFETIDNKHKVFLSKNRTVRLSTDRELMGMNDPVGLKRYSNTLNKYTPPYTYYHDEKIYEQLLHMTSELEDSATIVINEGMEILHMFGDMSDYLELPKGKMNSDISKLLKKDLSIPVATGIQRVIKKEENVNYSNIILSSNGSSKNIRLSINRIFNKKDMQSLIAIFIEKHPERVAEDSSEPARYDVSAEVHQRIQDLEQELQFNKESLQATIEELETSNEELQATNEELLASNEELQSTNEELQSVNEELYTVNSEHQDKIFELTELNNDLDNLLNSTQIGTLFLDDKMCIRKFTPMVEKLMNILDSDKGRPLEDLTHKMRDINLVKLAKEVYINSSTIETETRDKNGNWYFVRILPYYIAPSTYSGVVVTFIEINEVKDVERELHKHKLMHDITDEEVKIGHWDWNIATDEISWVNVEPIFGIEIGDFDGTINQFFSFVHPDDLPIVKAKIKASLEGRGKYSVEHRIITPSGEERWVHEFGQAVYDNDGKAVRMLGVAQDITEKKSMKVDLEEKIQFFTSLNEAAPIGIGMTKDRELVYVNQYISKMTGFEQDELLGNKSLIMFPSEEEYERIGCLSVEQMQSSGKCTVRSKWKCKNGELIDVELSTVPMDILDFSKGVVFTAVRV